MTDKAILADKAAEQKDELGALINRINAADWKPVTTNDGIKYTLPAELPKSAGDTALQSVVVVDESAHKTHVLQIQNGQLTDILTVPDAVGKHSSPTPMKRWEVSDKRLDPIWYPPADIGGPPVAPFKVNHHNPIGMAFIRLDKSNYGLHGTNRPDQIGKSVSHGCMRHNNEDILKIYPFVNPGTAVYTVAHFEGSKINFSDFSKR